MKELYEKFNQWSIEMTNALNNWLLNEGGNTIVIESAETAVVCLALMSFVGFLYERRNVMSMEIANERTLRFELLLLFNWVIGTLASFVYLKTGHIFTGLGLLFAVYFVPASRHYQASLIAFMMSRFPSLFHKYTFTETSEREKKISKYLHTKFRCKEQMVS